VAAEVGQLELAYDYFGEAALMDLHDIEHNTRDGLHIASLAGAWLAAVAGFGGMRDHNGRLTFAPRLPSQLQGLAFGLRFKGRRIRIEATREHATYRLLDGEPLELQHHGTSITITTDRPSTQLIPHATAAPATRSPFGREPIRRQTARDGTSFVPIGDKIGDSPLGADGEPRERRAA
jgi:alpha,alpha-trehalose phosphorylase